MFVLCSEKEACLLLLEKQLIWVTPASFTVLEEQSWNTTLSRASWIGSECLSCTECRMVLLWCNLYLFTMYLLQNLCKIVMLRVIRIVQGQITSLFHKVFSWEPIYCTTSWHSESNRNYNFRIDERFGSKILRLSLSSIQDVSYIVGIKYTQGL